MAPTYEKFSLRQRPPLLPTSLPTLSTKSTTTNALPPTTDRHTDQYTSAFLNMSETSDFALPKGPTDFATKNSAPAHQSRTTGHTMGWSSTTILTHIKSASQLDLTDHAAIQTRKPSLNRTDCAPLCSKLWESLLLKIAI